MTNQTTIAEKHVIITGASGFVGKHLVNAYSNRGAFVIAQARRPTSFRDSSRLQIITGDLLECIECLPAKIDIIVHAAARAPAPGVGLDDHLHDNVKVTRKLIDYAITANPAIFIFLSSMSLYGEVQTEVVDENTPRINPDLYGISKYLCEKMLQEHSTCLPSIALRLPGILGIGAKTPWVAKLLEICKANQEMVIYNPDANFNNAVHVSNLAKFIIDLSTTAHTGFDWLTLAAQGNTTIREVAAIIRNLANPKAPLQMMTEPRNSFIISSKKAEQQYGYIPEQIEPLIKRYVMETLS